MNMRKNFRDSEVTVPGSLGVGGNAADAGSEGEGDRHQDEI